MIYKTNKIFFRSITLLTITFLFFSSPMYASAHVLKTDGTIGAVMHVTPEDDPIAGDRSDFFFEFKDTQNRFQPAMCECVVHVIENGKQIYSRALFAENTNPSLQNTSFSYTFPKRGVYSLQVVGKPLTPGVFPKFQLTYDIRVDRISENKTESSTASESAATNFFTVHAIHLLPAGAAIVFMILLIRQKKKERSHGA